MKKYTPHNKSSSAQKINRETLYTLYENSPLPVDEMLINTGLYTRSSAFSKFLFLNEIYEKIIHIPGNILMFGTWWGQDVVVLYNLRAIHEPYNFTRRVIGFDTFTGYPEISEKDKLSDTIKKGAYGTSENYIGYLTTLLEYHEKENILSHIKKFELVKGDILKTLPQYSKRNPHEIISLVYIDVALYEPTKLILEKCLPRLAKGGLIVFDQLNAAEYPGETIAFREELGLGKYKIQRSKYLPDRSYIIIE